MTKMKNHENWKATILVLTYSDPYFLRFVFSLLEISNLLKISNIIELNIYSESLRLAEYIYVLIQLVSIIDKKL